MSYQLEQRPRRVPQWGRLRPDSGLGRRPGYSRRTVDATASPPGDRAPRRAPAQNPNRP
jgi:hypothetical protein